MNDTLTLIQNHLAKGPVPPGLMADYKVQLSAEYSFYSGLLEEILRRKPTIWIELRKQYNSDKATDRAYEATSDGKDEMGIRLRLKSIEKMISAISSKLRVAEGEARNQY